MISIGVITIGRARIGVGVTVNLLPARFPINRRQFKGIFIYSYLTNVFAST